MSRRDKLSNHKDVKSWFAYSGKFEFSLIPCDHYLCSDRPFCKLNFVLSCEKIKEMHFVCLCERNESLFMALLNSKSSVQMMESVMKSLRSSSPEVPSLYWTEEPLHAHLHNCHRQNHCLGLRYHFQ